MNCPKCGSEMEEGYLQASYKSGITWVKKLWPLGAGYFKLDSVYVSNDGNIGVESVKACICKQCKIFVGDYNE